MSLVPGKIVLKSSTSKTLSDRFAELAKTSRVENVRSRQRQQSYASLKNRRLAAHMEKRLNTSEETVSTQKKTIKSRLGLPIANRLGTRRGGTTVRGRGRGISGRTRGRQSAPGTRTSGYTPSSFQGGTRGRRGTRGRAGLTRGGRGRGRGGTNLVGERGRSGVRGRGGRGRGGRGRGRGESKKPVTQQQLDKELDTYMSKTKSALNEQLDQYMKSAGGD